MNKATEFYRKRMLEKLFAYWKNLNLKPRVIRKVDFVYGQILKKIKLGKLNFFFLNFSGFFFCFLERMC